MEIGAVGKIALEVRPPRAQALSAETSGLVVDLPKTSEPGEGTGKVPNINPLWVTKDDQFWVDEGWTDRSVAKVTRETDSVDIYVSAENARLSQLISRAQRKDLAAVENVKSFYLEHIAFFALLDDMERSELGKSSTSNDEDDDEQMALRLACETICGIIDSMFDLLVSGGRE
jgi:hypothetical protein